MRHQLDFLTGESYSGNNPPDIRVPEIRQDIQDVINWLEERINVSIKLDAIKSDIIDYNDQVTSEYYLKIVHRDSIFLLGLISVANDPDQALRDLHSYYKIPVTRSKVETRFIHPERQPAELTPKVPPDNPIGSLAFTLFGNHFYHVIEGDPRGLNEIYETPKGTKYRKAFVNDPINIFGGGFYYVFLG